MNRHEVSEGDDGDLGAALVAARLRRHWPAVTSGLSALYGERSAEVEARLSDLVDRHVARRPMRLRARDQLREAEPDWFQQPAAIGYVAYADRFAGDLPGVAARLDYLAELGITYLHLMPLLLPREGENDGGYAVAAYDKVDPRLGTMDDLSALADDLHGRDMSLCVDLVLNHTAAEHAWARRALAGDPYYRDFYFMFPDREMPDRYERTLREVFPTFAPGNFTWLEDAQRWVWTTFHEFQWDLNWSNPDVLVAMTEVMLDLSNVGVDVLRLDAAPFMWKREGTGCENLPEVHVLLCTLRAVMAAASPATIFKAEAIVAPADLTPYLGAGEPPRRECELAYHNQLMVLLWSSLATGEARLMTESLRRVSDIPDHAAWLTYVRCHDDIGWAITDENAGAVGWDGQGHRAFLNDFYAGRFPNSFARGEVFQFNPVNGDGRISGTAASLCGIESALTEGDATHLDLACRRLELVYAVAFCFGGVPLVYMGDELGVRNDHGYLAEPAHADDNRWMHRPVMEWDVAERRHLPGTLESRLFAVFRSLATDRAATPALHGSATVRVADSGDPSVLCVERHDAVHGRFRMLANFAARTVGVSLDPDWSAAHVVRSQGATVDAGVVTLAPYAYLWLTTPPLWR